MLPHIQESVVAFRKYVSAAKKKSPYTQLGTPRANATTVENNPTDMKETIQLLDDHIKPDKQRRRKGVANLQVPAELSKAMLGTQARKMRGWMSNIDTIAEVLLNKGQGRAKKGLNCSYNRSLSHDSIHLSKQISASRSKRTITLKKLNDENLCLQSSPKTMKPALNTCNSSPKRIRSTMSRCYTQGKVFAKQRALRKLTNPAKGQDRTTLDIAQFEKLGTLKKSDFSLELPDDSNFARMVNFMEELKNTIEAPYTEQSNPTSILTTKRNSCKPERDKVSYRPPAYSTNTAITQPLRGMQTPQQPPAPKLRKPPLSEKGKRLSGTNLIIPEENNPQTGSSATQERGHTDSGNKPHAFNTLYSPKSLSKTKVNITLHDPNQDSVVEYKKVTIKPIDNRIYYKSNNAAAYCYGMNNTSGTNKTMLGGHRRSVTKSFAAQLNQFTQETENLAREIHELHSGEPTVEDRSSPYKDGEVAPKRTKKVKLDFDKLRSIFHVQEREQVALVPKLWVRNMAENVKCRLYDVMFTLPKEFIKM